MSPTLKDDADADADADADGDDSSSKEADEQPTRGRKNKFTSIYTPESPPLETQLFKPGRTRNRGNFICIRLIAPAPLSGSKQYTSEEAVGAWCTLCHCPVMWRKGETNGLSRHMNKFHQDLLEEEGIERRRSNQYPIQPPQPSKRFKAGGLVVPKKEQTEHNPRKLASNITSANQCTFDALTASWVIKDLRLLSIIQDQGLHDVISFAASAKGKPKLPTSRALRLAMATLSDLCSQRIRNQMQSMADYYSVTVDSWQSLSAVRVHFVTHVFERHEFTLCTTLGRDIVVAQTLEQWGLQPSKLACLIQNTVSPPGTSNCDFQTPIVSGVGYSLHMVVRPFCCSSEVGGQTSLPPNGGEVCCADFEMDERALAAAGLKHVADVRHVVSKFRDLATFLLGDVEARKALHRHAKTLGGNDVPEPVLVKDIPRRWTTTKQMIESLVTNREAITALLEVQNKSPTSRFLKLLSRQDWAMLTGLGILMTPFYSLTETLALEREACGDGEPTMAYAYPFLCKVKEILTLPELFRGSDLGLASREKAGKSLKDALDKFIALYGDNEFSSVFETLENSQRTMKQELDGRFHFTEKTFSWVSMLDPRLRKLNHLTEEERAQARSTLATEMVELTTVSAASEAQEQNKTESGDGKISPSPMLSDMFSDMFDDACDNLYEKDAKSFASQQDSSIECVSPAMQSAQYEISQYLLAPTAGKTVSAFQWWRENSARFPMLSCVARKWLSAVAICSPKDRIFSTNGLADRLNGEDPSSWHLSPDFESQLQIRAMWRDLKLSIDEIAAMLRQGQQSKTLKNPLVGKPSAQRMKLL